ncbi:ABC transporter G family member 10-like [Andrographis paniculata]|uniref:ABC transporter G family member 10-like n=1 Tax=Andrographis paniculata TaxID=175694 RepID=UPI0021E894DB|nr:ABC transporter G family member 10-like [Andrographis paniculata]
MELPVKIIPFSANPDYTITARNLSYRLSPRDNRSCLTPNINRCILQNINCEARPGQLTAIAGPSGAGKTTLLEILSGTPVPGEISGDVLVNGVVMNAAAGFQRISGYVTQDDALFPHLTVEETLLYSARLRLPAGGGAGENAKARVQQLLKELGLEHVAGVRIGGESRRGVSGGERRRVSIGVDLVHNPAVLLVDEPTSGLDSGSAFDVMLLLKSMAERRRKTVVLTIHQPGFRILDLIDNVVLLSNGVVLHEGSLNLLEDRINQSGHSIPNRVNVLEFAIDFKESLNVEFQFGSMERDFAVSTNLSSEDRKLMLCYPNTPLKEVVILSQRFSNNILRNKQLFVAKTVWTLLAGIILGTVYVASFGNSKIMRLQNQVGFFAFTLSFLISSTVEAMPIFLQERKIVTRETSRGVYRVSSYLISNSLVFLPFLLIIALLYSTSVYWLVGLRRDLSAFLYFTLVVWMVVSMANSFVVCFSALVPDLITGMSLIYAIMGSFFLFSGYFISKDTIPKFWYFMQYLSLFKYPFECLLMNEFGGVHGRLRCVQGAEDVCIIFGNEFLKQQGLKEPQKWTNLVIMLSFIVGYRFLGFVFIRYHRSWRILWSST